VLVDPFGIVFDSFDGTPVWRRPGHPDRRFDRPAGAVFGDDGASSYPSA
jgi:hypothetical protein